MHSIQRLVAAIAVFTFGGLAAHADQQEIPPLHGQQNSTVISTGANGLCETTAAVGDVQKATIGQGTPNRNEVRCGTNKVVDSTAAGDDVQLIAVGATCAGANNVAIDTGPNGIAESALVSDDTYPSGITFGLPPSNTACVIAGEDGVAQTLAPTGDDTQLIVPGVAEANTGAILCGPNLKVDTTANNVAAGDDVQLVAVGAACTANQVVVDSGADGIATTRAEGPDLLIDAVRRQSIRISKGKTQASKIVKVKITNLEFGASAPATRAFKITVSGSTCPNGTTAQIDADAVTPGLQATANVPLGSAVKASLAMTVKLEDITSTSSRLPFRCSFDVNAVAMDTNPSFDDAANPANNTATVVLEVVDRNDL